MKTLTLNIPNNFDASNNEFTMILTTKLYEQSKLSLGIAKDFVELTKRTFVELLSKYGVAIFNYPATEL